jgi:hypothetical protein
MLAFVDADRANKEGNSPSAWRWLIPDIYFNGCAFELPRVGTGFSTQAKDRIPCTLGDAAAVIEFPCR